MRKLLRRSASGGSCGNTLLRCVASRMAASPLVVPMLTSTGIPLGPSTHLMMGTRAGTTCRGGREG
eukprot:2681531-Pyramimonas_sp.AAC.1